MFLKPVVLEYKASRPIAVFLQPVVLHFMACQPTAVLDTPVGTMQGHYMMRNELGTQFKAPIEVFRLSRPNILH